MKVNEVAEKIKISLGNIQTLKSILISNATEHKQILTELSGLGENSLPAAIITAPPTMIGRSQRGGALATRIDRTDQAIDSAAIR